ncbi:MAG: FMN-binding protein [Methylocystis sp.]|nr:FMN-binding protein [Methylocystis sp.]
MSDWVRWVAPAALASTAILPAHAVEYLSVAEAQRLAFPSATQFIPIAGGACRAMEGSQALGLVVVDHVIGKHLYIDFSVAIGPDGRIRRVDILKYRESYGGEVQNSSWLAQFVGKSNASALRVGSDIRNISGATLSSYHVTEGVKRVLAACAGRVR